MVRVAIVGAGGMARYHRDGFIRENAEIVAVCDSNVEKAKCFAGESNIENVFSSFDELLLYL